MSRWHNHSDVIKLLKLPKNVGGIADAAAMTAIESWRIKSPPNFTADTLPLVGKAVSPD